MVLVGALLGLLAALTLHTLFGQLRLRWPLPLAAIGWIGGGVDLYYAVVMARAYLSMKDDPLAELGPLWGILALLLVLVLLVCAGLGLAYRRRFGLPWARAFGVVMSEAVAAVVLGLLVNQLLYHPLVDLVIGRNDDTGAILASLDHVRDMLSCFSMVLYVSVLLLLVFMGNRAGFPRGRSKPAA